MRKDIFRYARQKFGAEPEYFASGPQKFPVLRHQDNRKWFAVLTNIPKKQPGLSGKDSVDVISVKVRDSMLADTLCRQTGYFQGCRIRRGNWVSILLDGTIPLEEICNWIDESYLITASRQTRQKNRPPKEWLVPANPKYYDIEHAFDEAKEIDWKQGSGIKAGDTVFLYVAAPVSAILYKCRVTDTDIPYDYTDGKLTITALMRIRLLRRYRAAAFTFAKLKENYGILSIRGPRGVPRPLSEALKK